MRAVDAIKEVPHGLESTEFLGTISLEIREAVPLLYQIDQNTSRKLLKAALDYFMVKHIYTFFVYCLQILQSLYCLEL